MNLDGAHSIFTEPKRLLRLGSQKLTGFVVEMFVSKNTMGPRYTQWLAKRKATMATIGMVEMWKMGTQSSRNA
jgi:hypothetical protein